MIGEKIRIIRILKGFSQEYMSQRLNISQPAYSDIEKNKTKLTLDTINDLAVIFELEIIDIINFDEKHVFNNAFNESYKQESQSYKNQIKALIDEIVFLRKKLDERN